MSSVTRVPQTRTMDEADLSAGDARETLRRHGRWKLVKDSIRSGTATGSATPALWACS